MSVETEPKRRRRAVMRRQEERQQEEEKITIKEGKEGEGMTCIRWTSMKNKEKNMEDSN